MIDHNLSWLNFFVNEKTLKTLKELLYQSWKKLFLPLLFGREIQRYYWIICFNLTKRLLLIDIGKKLLEKFGFDCPWDNSQNEV